MSKHQIIRTGRRCAIIEVANLAVRPADANFNRADFDLVWLTDARRWMRQDINLPLLREDAHGAHLFLCRRHAKTSLSGVPHGRNAYLLLLYPAGRGWKQKKAGQEVVNTEG